MGSKAKLYSISTLLGGLMLWTSSAPQSAVSSSPVPFLQAVRNEVSIARTFAPLFQLPAHVEVANAAPAPSPTPSTPPIVIAPPAVGVDASSSLARFTISRTSPSL